MINAGMMRKVRFTFAGIPETEIHRFLTNPEDCESSLREEGFIKEGEGIGGWNIEGNFISFYIVRKKDSLLIM